MLLAMSSSRGLYDLIAQIGKSQKVDYVLKVAAWVSSSVGIEIDHKVEFLRRRLNSAISRHSQ